MSPEGHVQFGHFPGSGDPFNFKEFFADGDGGNCRWIAGFFGNQRSGLYGRFLIGFHK